MRDAVDDRLALAAELVHALASHPHECHGLYFIDLAGELHYVIYSRGQAAQNLIRAYKAISGEPMDEIGPVSLQRKEGGEWLR
jgi:hypothetical protein